MNRIAILSLACVALAGSGLAQNDRDREVRGRTTERIPAGTQIPVRVDQTIDVNVPSDGRVFTGSVSQDVMGDSGAVLIPRGAKAELIVQNLGQNEGTVDLDSISFDGHRYMVESEKYDVARKTGVGKNERTARYVGGGAVFGTIIGAIAGGGKGAAIGALAGGAAGAAGQTATRGRSVKVPAETVITFRLEEPLRVAVDPYTEDRGYDENGVHYHNGYYNRRDRQ